MTRVRGRGGGERSLRRGQRAISSAPPLSLFFPEAEELADLEMNMGASAAMNAYVVWGESTRPHYSLVVKAPNSDPPAQLFIADKWRPI